LDSTEARVADFLEKKTLVLRAVQDVEALLVEVGGFVVPKHFPNLLKLHKLILLTRISFFVCFFFFVFLQATNVINQHKQAAAQVQSQALLLRDQVKSIAQTID
jgi:hypothetical protein